MRLEILDRENMQNEAQYYLNRKAAKISALSSNNLGKYEYLTDEDLELKPSTVEQEKFEYSPLKMSHSKGFKKDVKMVLREGVILIVIANMLFIDFTKGIMNLRRSQ